MHPDLSAGCADYTLGDLLYDILIKYDFGDQNLWVKTTSSASSSSSQDGGGGVDMLTFTGQPRKLLYDSKTSAKYCLLGSRQFASGWEDYFKCIIPLGGSGSGGDDDFSNVDSVVPVFEITTNPTEWHPTPYVAVPLVGPWDNWTQVHRLALRIDHLKDGKIVGQYQHAHDHTFPFKKYGKGSHLNLFLTGSWSRAMAWIATLTNLEWAPRSRFSHWALQRYSVVVEEIKPAFLLQSIVIAQPGPREIQEPPRRVKVEVNIQAMDKLYASDQPDITSVGFWSGSLLPSGRTTCDACHISMANPLAMHCSVMCRECAPREFEFPPHSRRQKSAWACDFCLSLGRVCTFTPEDYLDRHFDTFKSLGYVRVPSSSPAEMSASEKHAARRLLKGAAVPGFVKETVDPVGALATGVRRGQRG